MQISLTCGFLCIVNGRVAEGTVEDAQQGGQCRKYCPTRSAPSTVPDEESNTRAVVAGNVERGVLKTLFTAIFIHRFQHFLFFSRLRSIF